MANILSKNSNRFNHLKPALIEIFWKFIPQGKFGKLAQEFKTIKNGAKSKRKLLLGEILTISFEANIAQGKLKDIRIRSFPE